MTVASLWKALERAGCGRSVGVQDIVHLNHPIEKTNPWNYNEMNRSRITKRPTLAVDLSIWICESLTSTAMSLNHSNPPLQLVYSRTAKLLSLGIKLIMVVEGKRRLRRTQGQEGDDKFQRRRSGTRFWKACENCIEMLKLMGVPVFRAVAEGEALCALLNQRGVVDGVISNDGDCLLFGTKVLFTKFSIENMENSKVVRYDADKIKAIVLDDDEERPERENGRLQSKRQHEGDIIDLSREDLISFALLTGSDLAGNGLSNVGCRKALRFIRKCQLDNPLHTKEATINELKSWARAASVTVQLADSDESSDGRKAHCSCCSHPGSKLIHKKNGCKLCGTNPGESCYRVSPGGRFRTSLRAKALAMRPKFDPTMVVSAYKLPNNNQVPLTLFGKTSETLQMGSPRMNDMLRSSLIVRGHSLAESRNYLRQSLAKLITRTYLFNTALNRTQNSVSKVCSSQDRPKPQKIVKELFRNNTPCYEVLWTVPATVTDEDGNCVDGYEFLSVENRDLIKKSHPNLIQAFQDTEKERKKQGDSQQIRRREFLINSFSRERGDQQCYDKKRSRTNKRRPKYFRRDQSFQRQPKSLRRPLGEHFATNLSAREAPSDPNPKGSGIAPSQAQIIRGELNEGDSDKSVRKWIHHRDVQSSGNSDLSSIASHEPSATCLTSRQFRDKKGTSSLAIQYIETTLTPGHLHFSNGQATSRKNKGMLRGRGILKEMCDVRDRGYHAYSSQPRSVITKPNFKRMRVPHEMADERSSQFASGSNMRTELRDRFQNCRGKGGVQGILRDGKYCRYTSSTKSRDEPTPKPTTRSDTSDRSNHLSCGASFNWKTVGFAEDYSSPPWKRARPEVELARYHSSLQHDLETPLEPKQLKFSIHSSQYQQRHVDEISSTDRLNNNNWLLNKTEESVDIPEYRSLYQFEADSNKQLRDASPTQKNIEKLDTQLDFRLYDASPLDNDSSQPSTWRLDCKGDTARITYLDSDEASLLLDNPEYSMRDTSPTFNDLYRADSSCINHTGICCDTLAQPEAHAAYKPEATFALSFIKDTEYPESGNLDQRTISTQKGKDVLQHQIHHYDEICDDDCDLALSQYDWISDHQFDEAFVNSASCVETDRAFQVKPAPNIIAQASRKLSRTWCPENSTKQTGIWDGTSTPCLSSNIEDKGTDFHVSDHTDNFLYSPKKHSKPSIELDKACECCENDHFGGLVDSPKSLSGYDFPDSLDISTGLSPLVCHHQSSERAEDCELNHDDRDFDFSFACSKTGIFTLDGMSKSHGSQPKDTGMGERGLDKLGSSSNSRSFPADTDAAFWHAVSFVS